MSYIIPNQADGDNGNPYGDVDYDSSDITRANDAATFTWMGELTSSYTATPTSAPQITISFDVIFFSLKFGLLISKICDACLIYGSKSFFEIGQFKKSYSSSVLQVPPQ